MIDEFMMKNGKQKAEMRLDRSRSTSRYLGSGVVHCPSHFCPGPGDYHIYPRWLTPYELLVAQGIPVFGGAVPWAKDPFVEHGDPDCRRIQQVSSFQRDVPRRSRGQLCHLDGWMSFRDEVNVVCTVCTRIFAPWFQDWPQRCYMVTWTIMSPVVPVSVKYASGIIRIIYGQSASRVV